MLKTDIQDNDTKFPLLFMAMALAVSSVLLFTPDPYYGHDVGFQLSRIQSIADCLHNGTFPALVYPNYFGGYGYANGIFYPDLFLYVPGFITFLGLPCKTSYQFFLFLINLATLASMFFCIDKIIKNRYSSSLIACLYLLSSYRITDLYTRSALGETLCFIFVPFIMLGIYEIFFNDQTKGYYVLFGLFGVLSSHIITLLSCVIFIFAAYFFYLPVLIKNKADWSTKTWALFLWCALSIGVCAFFLFPFLEAYVSDAYLFKTAPATGGWDRAMPFLSSFLEIPSYRNTFVPLGIGIVFVIFFIMFLILAIRNEYRNTIVLFFLSLGALFHLISTDLFPWALFKGFAQLIQFPWRFLIIATCALLFGFAPILTEFTKKPKDKICYTLLMILSAGFTVVCSGADLYIFHDFHLYSEDVHYSVGGAEYLPSDVDLSTLDGGFISNHEITLDFTKKGTSLSFSYKNNPYDDTFLEVPLIYYKGYKAKDSNGPLPVYKGNNGLVRIELGSAENAVSVYYGFTNIRIIGYIVSLLSFASMTVILKKKS